MKIRTVRFDEYSEDQQDERVLQDVFRIRKDHKFSIELDDGLMIECASFERKESGQSSFHTCACILTQAGCKFDCSFCVSGKQGFTRNLSGSEISGQVQIMAQHLGIPSFNHVVFMGIGEPLDNFDNVVVGIQAMIHDHPSYAGNVSIATVGVMSKFQDLLRLKNLLRMLWVSLHAPTDEKRRMIMPVAKIWSVKELVSGAVAFARESGVETWINYMLFHGFNDLDEDVAILTDLLSQTPSEISLMLTIPNGTVEGFCPGTTHDVRDFEQKLIKAGLKNPIVYFVAAGRPVKGGCGEFVFLPHQKLDG